MDDNLFRLRLSPDLLTAINEQATRYGITPDEVLGLAVEEGLPRIASRAAKIQKDRVMKAWLEEKLETYTLREVGPMLGYSHENVRTICARLGVANPRRQGRPRGSGVPSSSVLVDANSLR